MWYKHIDMSWTVFLDRDGVINKRIFGGYVTKVEDFHFLPGVLEGLQKLAEIVGNVFVVTNQQGVAKNLMSIHDLQDIHDNMVNEVANSGGKIDYVFSAVNIKGAAEDNRKPNPYMAFKAKELFPTIDFEKSVMIGDTNGDIAFGNNLGMKTVLVRSDEVVTETPDLYVDSLLNFINYL
jgi:D-glycero-D-manno-heptose 1,7-bisphosphate phosphatase